MYVDVGLHIGCTDITFSARLCKLVDMHMHEFLIAVTVLFETCALLCIMCIVASPADDW